LSGVLNLAAPNPLPNRDFMRDLRQAWGARFGIPASASILELGAMFLRTETELVLKSRRVVPTRLLNAGFRFQFPEWSVAAQDLVARWRKKRSRLGA
jgi:NAD dependent epimerase/dehydratase family enzyme